MIITSKYGFSLSLKYIENNAYGSNPKSCLGSLDTNRYSHRQISTSFIRNSEYHKFIIHHSPRYEQLV